MTVLRPLLFGVLLALLMGSGPSLLSEPQAEATQATRISLDMVTSGNGYDETTNSMSVGAIDNCLATALPGNNAQHNHTAHLVIQNVEDLIGWQARLNYNGGQMRPSAANFTPFTDSTTGQNVSFLNLPLEGGVHRGLVTASTIPPQAIGPQTALIGATYQGAQTAAVSPDTPAKAAADDTTYSAPSGGVLAGINLQVLANQAAQPSLYIDLDDGDPNAPGSGITVFDGTGSSPLNLAESDLSDGFHAEGVPCVPVAPPAVPLPPPAPPAGSGGGDSPSADSDGDGFSDTVEPPVGTDPLRPCGIDAWPADINNDGNVDMIHDISLVAAYAWQSVPPAPERYDIAPDPPDGIIDVIGDLSTLGSMFGTQCDTDFGFKGPCNAPQYSGHWYTRANSGTGSTSNGTKLWTYTPANWSVDKPGGSAWNEAAWLWWNPNPTYVGTPGGNSLEVGFFSGWWPYSDPPKFEVGLVPYYTIDNGYPGYRLWLRDNQIVAAANPPALSSPLFVPASSWVPIEAVSGGPSTVYTFTFPATNPDGSLYVVQKPSFNTSQGEILFSTRTWMGGGAGEGFWGYWTDSNDPDREVPNKWYNWGFHDTCRDLPYWVKTSDEYHYRWQNGGYGQ